MADRPRETQFDSQVRLVVADSRDLRTRYAANLSTGGMFIQNSEPLPVGSRILIEIAFSDGRSLCRLVGEVIHSKPSLAADDETAGMGVRFVQMDDAARQLAIQFYEESTAEATERLKAIPPPRPIEVDAQSPVVGIDLGTINSCVAYVNAAGEPQVITSDKGYETIPSVVHYSDGNEGESVGHSALERMLLDPNRAVYGSKRFLGRVFRTKEVQALGHFFHYGLEEATDGSTSAKIDTREIPLEDVSARILSELIERASTHLGRSVERAVVTVPAYFGESQRAATVAAGRRAGIKIERLINEPTAAAIAFGMLRPGTECTVLAYDLGGGTFDASLMRIKGTQMQVLASEGDPFLGGTDFDDRLIQFVLFGVERQYGDALNLRGDPVAIQRIRFAVELAKRELSDASEATVDVPYIATLDGTPVDIRVTVERELFESLTQDLVDRTLGIVQRVLDRVQMSSDRIDELILVGGQSRSPHVAASLRARFGKSPSKRVHPDHAVALGAALIAHRVFGPALPVNTEPDDIEGDGRFDLPKSSPPPLPRATGPALAAPAGPSLLGDRDASPLEVAKDEPTIDLEPSSPPPSPTPIATDIELTDIVTASLHLVMPDGTMRTLLPLGTPLPAERDVYLPPTRRSSTEYLVVLVRGEFNIADLNEPVCSVRIPELLARRLSGAKARIWVRLGEDGQMELVAEHMESGEALSLLTRTASLL